MGRRTSLGEIALLFLKLGTTAFGGPAAHIAMMEDEVVRRRRWLTAEEFLDYLSATNLIPGPNSTELAIHIGFARAGWPGLITAGACFIFPAALIVTALAWAYVRYGALPAAAGLLYGVKPVVIAVVLQALWRLAGTALKSRELILLGIAAILASAIGINELLILIASGVVIAVKRTMMNRARGDAPSDPSSLTGLLVLLRERLVAPRLMLGAAVTGTAPFGLLPLFGVFLKIGSVLFGSGYVLLAFLRTDLVERLHWLTERQLLDAVAVGQITPGPVFTTATFIGFVLGGGGGAAVATVGIFLPAFVFVALSGLVLPYLRRSPTARAVLDGVNVASLALMAVVTWQLGRAALIDPLTWSIALISAALLLRSRLSSAWLVIGGGLLGMAATMLRA
jgi:chromate transporter